MALVETLEPPVYQRIARKALQLRELGMSDRAIAGRLGVTDKTIAKAIAWVHRGMRRGRLDTQHGLTRIEDYLY